MATPSPEDTAAEISRRVVAACAKAMHAAPPSCPMDVTGALRPIYDSMGVDLLKATARRPRPEEIGTVGYDGAPLTPDSIVVDTVLKLRGNVQDIDWDGSVGL